MGLYDLTGRSKVQVAIDRMRAFEPPEGYYLAFSGGKDSQAIIELAKLAGVKYDAHYRVTSVDPPELVRFIKAEYPEVHLDFPRDKNGKVVTMWNLIPRKLMPPTRIARYCCAELKETGGQGRLRMTGVRWAESSRRQEMHGAITVHGGKAMKALAQSGAEYRENRKHGAAIMNYDDDDTRRVVEQCYRTGVATCNPIIDWSDADVWEYLDDEVKRSHCELYDAGFARLGCIGCPMNTNAKKELDRWPKFREAYLRAFDRMLEDRSNRGLQTSTWKTGEDVMDWMYADGSKREIPLDGQMDINDYLRAHEVIE